MNTIPLTRRHQISNLSVRVFFHPSVDDGDGARGGAAERVTEGLGAEGVHHHGGEI